MSNSINESIGDRLRKARQQRGYTQAKFADSLNIPARTYIGWEYDTAEPSARGLKALRTVHQIDLPWLLVGVDEQITAAPAKIDLDRFRDIFGKVSGVFDEVGQRAAGDTISTITVAIYNEPQDREAQELEKLKLYLNANKPSAGRPK